MMLFIHSSLPCTPLCHCALRLTTSHPLLHKSPAASTPQRSSSTFQSELTQMMCVVVAAGVVGTVFRHLQTKRKLKQLLPVEPSSTSESSSSSSSSTKPTTPVKISDRVHYILDNDTTPIQNKNHFIRLKNPEQYPFYDSWKHPNGYISVAISENKNVMHLLQPLLSIRPNFGLREMSYNDFNGMTHVRQAVAKFWETFIAGRPINPESILMTAGCNVALDSLFWSIANPGEYCLLARPYYAAFKWDMGLKSGVLIHEVESNADDGFRLNLNSYKRALAEARAAGKVVRAVLLCNPNNPLGTIPTREEILELVEWVKSEPDLHLISDEIYALSTFAHLLPDPNTTSSSSFLSCISPSTEPPPRSPFVSLSNALPSAAAMGDRFHVVYSISKDFGLSGFRCGWVYTENKEVIQAYQQLGQFNGLSTDVEHFVYQLFSNEELLVNYLYEMRKQLVKTATMLQTELRAAKIPFIQPQATLFMWLDLRQWLKAPTPESELELYDDLLRECNVNLVPGSNFHSPSPGWFRFCHAAIPYEVVQVAVKRITKYLQTRLK